MELSTVAQHLAAFYRLVGATSSDDALTEQGETENEVGYLYLTRGCRAAQRWMLKKGYAGWRTRSSALTWTGTDETTGGRYSDLPSNFLRAYGDRRKRSCLVEANGTQWGTEIDPTDEAAKGDYYFFRGDELWIARSASPPSTLYLDYHFTHPAWASDVTIDFPAEARWLVVAEAANVAKEEAWLPGGQDMEAKIERALVRARAEAEDVARPSKAPRQIRGVRPHGNRW